MRVARPPVWPSLLLLAAANPLLAATPTGLWYDRQHPGHGLDLHQAGDQWFGTLYTYDASGASQWLWLQGAINNPGATPLTRYTQENGQLVGRTAGTIQLDLPAQQCPDGVPRPGARALLRLRFELDGRPRDWCVEPLLPAETVPYSALSGAWSDPTDPGWGLLAHFYPAAEGGSQSYLTVYYHDEQGQPRWAFDQSTMSGFDQSHRWKSVRNGCLDCDGLVASASIVGAGEVRLASTQTAPTAANHLALQLAGPTSPTVVFARSAALQMLSDPPSVEATASTTEGLVGGQAMNSGITGFLGVPYVTAPVAARRWQAAATAPARADVLQTRSFGPGCPQSAEQSAFSGAPASVSEDCLSLNIWTPPGAVRAPVMVWIHGGGFVAGSSAQLVSGQSLYDGARLASYGVVVVSINYRLGPLGFAALRDFPGSANLGLQDQIAALKWLRSNIGAFGGDPAQLTIFGESAGGVSVCALMASPQASGLFQRAIMQSGNCLKTSPTLDAAYAAGDDLVTRAGCASAADTARCMRDLSAAAILEAGQGTVGFGREGQNYGPVIDGVVLPQSLQQRVTDGSAAQVPLLIGVNDDEMTTLLAPASLPTTAAAYEAKVRASFALIATQVLARYPLSDYPSAQRAWQDLYDDLAFTCANRRAAADHAARGNPVYHYALTEVFPDLQLAPLESFHGADIPLLFGPRAQAAAGETALSLQMQRMWTDFAKGQVPSQADGQAWPQYRASSRVSVRLDHTAPGSVFNDYRGAYCEFWGQFVQL